MCLIDSKGNKLPVHFNPFFFQCDNILIQFQVNKVFLPCSIFWGVLFNLCCNKVGNKTIFPELKRAYFISKKPTFWAKACKL